MKKILTLGFVILSIGAFAQAPITIGGAGIGGGGGTGGISSGEVANIVHDSMEAERPFNAMDTTFIYQQIATKQATLVNTTNLRSINGTTLLGSGNISTTQTTITGNAGTVTGFTPASGSLTLSGADAVTITTTNTTNVTLPTSGTLATNQAISDSLNKINQYIYPATHYVATWGSDANAGTFYKPWLTWQKAADNADPGDLIYVRGGIYQTSGAIMNSIWIKRDGTSANPIKFFAYPGETPIFDASNWDTSVAIARRVIFMDTASYWHFKGLEIRNIPETFNDSVTYLPTGITNYSSDHNTFEQLNIHHSGWVSLYVAYSNDIDIINCDFHHNYDPWTIQTVGGHYVSHPGTHADGARFSYQEPGDTIRMSGCRLWDNSDNAIDCFYNSGVVYVDNCWAWNTGRETGDGDAWKLGPQMYYELPGWTPTDAILRYMTNNIAVYNKSTTASGEAPGMEGGGFVPNGGRMGKYYYNNIAAFNDGTGFRDETDTIVSYWKNNISFSNGLPNSIKENIVNIDIHKNNSWDSPVSVSSEDFITIDSTGLAGERQADGSLPVLNFLKLKPKSDLIDAGVVTDPDQLYYGDEPDMGPFESQYHAETVDTVIEFSSFQPATLNQVTISIMARTGADIWLDWGDGNAEVKLVADSTDDAYTSNYPDTDSVRYEIRIHGDVDKISDFTINNEVTVNIAFNQFHSYDLWRKIYIYNPDPLSHGSIDWFPRHLTTLYLRNVGASDQLSGTLDSLSQDLVSLTLRTAGTNLKGNLSSLSPNLTTLYMSYGSSWVDISAGTFPAWANCNISLIGEGYTTAQIDAFLNKYVTTAGSGAATIYLSGAPNQARSSASDAAVTTLNGLLKTVN